ncbi:hypothetical protein KK062_22495 [Fulvivirgaceae bacterium PWU5]|uniref:Uncharacterized protein n=1 Tax=Dawidia cretensis TaxID=2782350 RepID=A0AAP2GVS3_9BACT|nr:hypothetical protein [Dawidia cretensis]MBT1711030.1 hypothetical protein [Dawidia cretensis]
MPIQRSSDQKRQTLREFYIELKNYDSNPVWATRGQAMLDFLDLIDQNFKQTKIWGLTSHDTLLLLAEDNWESGWFVAISNIGTTGYHFEYRMPEHKSPWPNAIVKGVAPTIQDSMGYLAIAMKESEGWPDNKEVNKLLEGTAH